MTTPITFHVGLPKTGSSLLQSRIFPEMEGLRTVSWPYLHASHAWNRLQFSDDSCFDPSDLVRDVETWGGERFVVSLEDLAGEVLTLHGINRSAVARRLAAAFPDATVLLFLRGQETLLRSAYSEYVRKRGIERPETWLRVPGPSLGWAEYRALLERGGAAVAHGYDTSRHLFHDPWRQGVSPEAFRYRPLVDLYHGLFEDVHVLLFEDLAADPEAMAGRLAGLMGTRYLGSDRLPRANPSLGRLQTRTLRQVNRLAYVASPLREAAYAAIRGLPRGRPFAFSEALRERIRETFRDDNAALHAARPEIGLDRHGESYFLD